MPDLTIAECAAAGHHVTVWCVNRCPGHDLDLSKLGRWADLGLVELAEAGKFKCSACGSPAGFLTVSAHLVAEAVLRWEAGALARN